MLDISKFAQSEGSQYLIEDILQMCMKEYEREDDESESKEKILAP